MVDSHFWDTEIQANLYRVLPAILTMFLSLKPFPQQEHLFKFRTCRKPEASLLFSADRSSVGLNKGLFPALSPTTWQPSGHKDVSTPFKRWKGVNTKIFQEEQTKLQCQQKWEGSMSNWDDVEGERGKKESLLSHSTQRPQEHRSWNTSGKTITEGSTENEETKIYSSAAAIWHSYRETIKIKAHQAQLKQSGGFCSCCFCEINRLKVGELLKCAYWKQLTVGFALCSYQHKCLPPAKVFPCKYHHSILQITLATSWTWLWLPSSYLSTGMQQ